MYVPRHFEQSRLDVLHAAIERIQIATLVTNGADGPYVSHIPLMLERDAGPFGKLVGHVSRANPHWKEAGKPAVAIFFGPDGYISPNWYPTKRESGKVVPTWDYIAVHARGPLVAFDERDHLHAMVTSLTDLHEARNAHPWHVDDAPESFVESQLKGIVGIEIPIETLTGKWKLSQNRPGEDIDGVVRALRALSDEGSIELASEVESARTDR